MKPAMDIKIVLSLVILILFGVVLASRAILRWNRARREARERRRKAEETARRDAQIIREIKTIIAQSKNVDTISGPFKITRDHPEKITASPEPHDLPEIREVKTADLKTFYRTKKDKIVHDRIFEQIDRAMAKAETVSKATAKITCLEKALILVLDGQRTVLDEAVRKELDARGRDIHAAIALALKSAIPESPED